MLLRYWTVNHENCHIDKELKKKKKKKKKKCSTRYKTQ